MYKPFTLFDLFRSHNNIRLVDYDTGVEYSENDFNFWTIIYSEIVKIDIDKDDGKAVCTIYTRVGDNK